MNKEKVIRAILDDIPVTLDIQLSGVRPGGKAHYEIVFKMIGGSTVVLSLAEGDLKELFSKLNRTLSP